MICDKVGGFNRKNCIRSHSLNKSKQVAGSRRRLTSSADSVLLLLQDAQKQLEQANQNKEFHNFFGFEKCNGSDSEKTSNQVRVLPKIRVRTINDSVNRNEQPDNQSIGRSTVDFKTVEKSDVHADFKLSSQKAETAEEREANEIRALMDKISCVYHQLSEITIDNVQVYFKAVEDDFAEVQGVFDRLMLQMKSNLLARFFQKVVAKTSLPNVLVSRRPESSETRENDGQLANAKRHELEQTLKYLQAEYDTRKLKGIGDFAADFEKVKKTWWLRPRRELIDRLNRFTNPDYFLNHERQALRWRQDAEIFQSGPTILAGEPGKDSDERKDFRPVSLKCFRSKLFVCQDGKSICKAEMQPYKLGPSRVVETASEDWRIKAFSCFKLGLVILTEKKLGEKYIWSVSYKQKNCTCQSLELEFQTVTDENEDAAKADEKTKNEPVPSDFGVFSLKKNRFVVAAFAFGVLVECNYSKKDEETFQVEETRRVKFDGCQFRDFAFCADCDHGVITFCDPHNKDSCIVDISFRSVRKLLHPRVGSFFRKCAISKRRFCLVEDSNYLSIEVYDLRGTRMQTLTEPNSATWRMLSKLTNDLYVYSWTLVEHLSQAKDELRIVYVTNPSWKDTLVYDLNSFCIRIGRANTEKMLEIDAACQHVDLKTDEDLQPILLNASENQSNNGTAENIFVSNVNTYYHSIIRFGQGYLMIDLNNNCIVRDHAQVESKSNKSTSDTNSAHSLKTLELDFGPKVITCICALNDDEILIITNDSTLRRFSMKTMKSVGIVHFSADCQEARRAFALKTFDGRLLVATRSSSKILDFQLSLDSTGEFAVLGRRYKFRHEVIHYADIDAPNRQLALTIRNKLNESQLLVASDKFDGKLVRLPQPVESNWAPYPCAVRGDSFFAFNYLSNKMYIYSISCRSAIRLVNFKFYIGGILFSDSADENQNALILLSRQNSPTGANWTLFKFNAEFLSLRVPS